MTYDPSLHDKLPYDTMRDLAPVADGRDDAEPAGGQIRRFRRGPPQDLITMAHHKPGSITFATGGFGSSFASHGSAVQRSVGNEVQPRALQGRRTSARRCGRRAYRFHGRDHAGRDPAGPRRRPARPRRLEPRTVARGAGRAGRSPKPDCPATNMSRGSASSLPARRRPNWSHASIAWCAPRCRRRRRASG